MPEVPSLAGAFLATNSGGDPGNTPAATEAGAGAPPAASESYEGAPFQAAPPVAPVLAAETTAPDAGLSAAPEGSTDDAAPAPQEAESVTALRAEVQRLQADLHRQSQTVTQREQQAQAEQRQQQVAAQVIDQRATDYQARVDSGELTLEEAQDRLRGEISLAQREDRLVQQEQQVSVQRFESDLGAALAQPENKAIPATFARAYAAVMPLSQAIAAARQDVQAIKDAAITEYEHKRAQAPRTAPIAGGGAAAPAPAPLDPRKISLSQAYAMSRNHQ